MMKSLTLAAATLVAAFTFATTANAAPVNLAGIAKAKAGTELIQVRGGRGGGGFRGGGCRGGHRFGGGRHFGGHRFRHGGRHFGRPGCRARWCGPHGGRPHWKRHRKVYIGGGYVGSYGSDCGYFYNRWQATGSYHWKARYYACLAD